MTGMFIVRTITVISHPSDDIDTSDVPDTASVTFSTHEMNVMVKNNDIQLSSKENPFADVDDLDMDLDDRPLASS